jgi:hypothetical protein
VQARRLGLDRRHDDLVGVRADTSHLPQARRARPHVEYDGIEYAGLPVDVRWMRELITAAIALIVLQFSICGVIAPEQHADVRHSLANSLNVTSSSQRSSTVLPDRVRRKSVSIFRALSLAQPSLA